MWMIKRGRGRGKCEGKCEGFQIGKGEMAWFHPQY